MFERTSSVVFDECKTKVEVAHQFGDYTITITELAPNGEVLKSVSRLGREELKELIETLSFILLRGE